jgi:hypothetical protein
MKLLESNLQYDNEMTKITISNNMCRCLDPLWGSVQLLNVQSKVTKNGFGTPYLEYMKSDEVET